MIETGNFDALCLPKTLAEASPLLLSNPMAANLALLHFKTLLSSSSSPPLPTPFLHLKPLLVYFSSRNTISTTRSSCSIPPLGAQKWRDRAPAAVSFSSHNSFLDGAEEEEEEEDAGVTGSRGFDWGQQDELSDEGEALGGSTAGYGLANAPRGSKIFVGNLPFDVDSERLAQLFSNAGEVQNAEVIYDHETERSRGFGFITMCDSKGSVKAISMFNQFEIDGRSLTVNIASPRGSRPIRSSNTSDPSHKIYVGNLPWQVDNAQLAELFSEHGDVLDARIVYDRESGKSRGFGFVRMSSESNPEDVIAALDGKNLDGRSIRVDVAAQRP